MRTFMSAVIGILIGIVLVAMAGMVYVRATGLDNRATPGAIESRLARLARRFAVPGDVRALRNPVTSTSEVVAEGMSHFADHCASCHANDGSGDTEMGRGLYPRAPDMRLPATQGLSDGELFYVIEHGIRFTGMPAWSTGTKDGEASTWRLVHFIRRLSKLTAAEVERMKQLNPRSPEEIRLEIEEEHFLNEGANP